MISIKNNLLLMTLCLIFWYACRPIVYSKNYKTKCTSALVTNTFCPFWFLHFLQQTYHCMLKKYVPKPIVPFNKLYQTVFVWQSTCQNRFSSAVREYGSVASVATLDNIRKAVIMFMWWFMWFVFHRANCLRQLFPSSQ